MRDFLTALAATRGVTLPSRNVPSVIARPLAGAVQSLWSVFAPQSKPPMVSFAIAMLSRSVTVKTDKARRELGYAPVVSVEEGLEDYRAACVRRRCEAVLKNPPPAPDAGTWKSHGHKR